MCRLSWNLGASTSCNPQDLSRPVIGLLFHSQSIKPIYSLTSATCAVGWYSYCPNQFQYIRVPVPYWVEILRLLWKINHADRWVSGHSVSYIHVHNGNSLHTASGTTCSNWLSVCCYAKSCVVKHGHSAVHWTGGCMGPRTGLKPLALCEVISQFLGIFTRENKKDLYGDLVHTYGRTWTCTCTSHVSWPIWGKIRHIGSSRNYVECVRFRELRCVVKERRRNFTSFTKILYWFG